MYTGGERGNIDLLYSGADGLHFFHRFFYRHHCPIGKDISGAQTSDYLANFPREKAKVVVGAARRFFISQRATPQTGTVGFSDGFSHRPAASDYRPSGIVWRV
jgi:hypothetical protein